MVALPLVKDERLLGVLAVYSLNPDEYTDDHLRLLDTVSRLASDAFSNAMHHAEAESNALTDPLTGLPNARSLHLRFEEEEARARRADTSFQVVMLDLDDFKQVNDTYGHQHWRPDAARRWRAACKSNCASMISSRATRAMSSSPSCKTSPTRRLTICAGASSGRRQFSLARPARQARPRRHQRRRGALRRRRRNASATAHRRRPRPCTPSSPTTNSAAASKAAARPVRRLVNRGELASTAIN